MGGRVRGEELEVAVRQFLSQQRGRCVRFTLRRLFFSTARGCTRYRSEVAARRVVEAIRSFQGAGNVHEAVLRAAMECGWYGLVERAGRRAYITLWRLR